VCGAAGKSKCGACGLAYYCGPACQRADWPNHRLVCGTGGPRPVGAAALLEALEAAQCVLTCAEAMRDSDNVPRPESLGEYCDAILGFVGPLATAQPVRAVLLRACEALEAAERGRVFGEALRGRLG